MNPRARLYKHVAIFVVLVGAAGDRLALAGGDCGACCRVNGRCGMATEDQCLITGGQYFGDGVACESIQCVGGACCYDNGPCLQRAEVVCDATGGQYQGDGTDCDDRPHPCGHTLGACCFAEGLGFGLPELICIAFGGEYLGDGSNPDDCGEVVGACCGSSCAECTEGTLQECAQGNDLFFQGPGTECAGVTCIPGACCFATGFCAELPAGLCMSLGATFQGDGTLCADIDCPELPGDINGDGAVDVIDLIAIILAWGPCAECPEDLDGDGVVDVSDLVTVILNWSA